MAVGGIILHWSVAFNTSRVARTFSEDLRAPPANRQCSEYRDRTADRADAGVIEPDDDAPPDVWNGGLRSYAYRFTGAGQIP